MLLTPRQHNVLSYVTTLLIMPLAWHLTTGEALVAVTTTRVPAALWAVHFLRRTLESAFVHVYSQPSISVLDTVGELAYYWTFGAWIGHSCASGENAALLSLPPWASIAGLALFACAECMNGRMHWQLASLRSGSGAGGAAAKKKRMLPAPPRCSPIFSLVCCPHYFFEIMSWVGFNVAVGPTTAGLGFAMVGAAIVTQYARERHAAYALEFGAQFTAPYAIIPWVV